MPSTLTREEFDSRLSDVTQRVTRLESQIEQEVRDIKTDIREVYNLVNASRLTVWKFIAMAAVNALISGSVFSILIGTGHIH